MENNKSTNGTFIDMPLPESCRKCIFNQFFYVNESDMFRCYILQKIQNRIVNTTPMKTQRHEQCPLHTIDS